MAKVISQETFDEVVKENIVDFSMAPDEAKEETIKQFEAQGINLANIIKDLTINPDSGKPVLNEIIDEIKTYIGQKSTDTKKLLDNLNVLDTECQKSISHRVLAGKNGAHEALVTLLEQELATQQSAEEFKPNLPVLEGCLKAANSFTNKQPDIFDAEALAIILKLLAIENEDITILTLQWLQKASIMHEINRQNIANAGVIKKLKPFVSKQSSVKLIREVLAVLRYLVLDDDIRVEFGCAHEHARRIASEYIVDLTKLLGEYKDPNVLADLMLTIGALAVRQEFCTTIEDAGGLKLVFDIMIENSTSTRVNREALKLLRALGGNDTVKAHIVQQGVAPIIKQVLEMHMTNENVVSAALACVATLTLRVKDNSVVFFGTGIAEAIVETLRKHPNNKIIQRNGAWSIRNMVSRSRDQCESWLSYGVEDLLNAAMSSHPSIQQDIKAALRDLGCKVELREEFTGVAEKKIIGM
ncbi:PREDICTED: armadillo repeat-containing protein 6 homolog [Rhagoletis zephyria]|uniref:armadillo repeat-containing protein 6 homolog n=1 Tax=Rhagoletis zephyria TaxID=28612 RepID=UPI000811A641|nr:PREDICTED: armadillo repeat-containing protein 6 homolog [Rhagoletis zephyria]